MIGNQLLERGGPCSIVPTPGVVPRVHAESNFRIPGPAVTCSLYQEEEYRLTDPALVIEILSPSNKVETWSNVWAYTTIPSIHEILIVSSTAIRAELLRRGADGNWPERPLAIDNGTLKLRSIGFSVDLPAIYRGTRLTRS